MVVSCGLAAELHYARKLPEQRKGIRISQNVSHAKPQKSDRQKVAVVLGSHLL